MYPNGGAKKKPGPVVATPKTPSSTQMRHSKEKCHAEPGP
jgi:hypothetical protein